jgi:hypothetical protein
MKIKVAIQCIDRRTLQKGTFGYRRKENYSMTPVFADMVELIAYCEKHDIERDYTNEQVTS